MHASAMVAAQAFLGCYGKPPPCNVLEVGSGEVNGSLRSVIPKEWDYLGIDIQAGAGVDLVVDKPGEFPIVDDGFDLIVSSSCFEHDALFWVTFLEMCRVVKPSGFIYINATSEGPYHGYPLDCWRFTADAGKALMQWAEMMKKPLVLLEAFVQRLLGGIWTDNVMIFGRPPLPPPPIETVMQAMERAAKEQHQPLLISNAI